MKKKFFSLFLIISLLLTGCQSPQEKHFQAFADELFRSYAAGDSLTLNYLLASPEKYEITNLPNGFPSFREEDLMQNVSGTENTLARLQQFNRESLSDSNRLLYDSLSFSLQLEKENYTFRKYFYNFDPSSGIQAQLPVLLSEFMFNEPNDINQYLALLQTLPDYFSSLISLEKAKKVRRTLPCRKTLKNTIRQCEEFLSASGTEPLQKSFQKKLAALSFLSEKEKTMWEKKQKNYLKTCLIPAYKNLIRELKNLLASAPEDGAIASYPDGKKYYRYLVKEKTGTGSSPEELYEELNVTLTGAEQKLLSIAKENPSAFLSCENKQSRYTDPQKTLLKLKEKIKADFPPLSGQTCHIRYVDSSLENFLSPAFYLTPPIDDSDSNIIYINGSTRYQHSSLFNTLAHEGYPGHLYQNCYARKKNLHPLRYTLNFPGYTEGYATYVEIYSYRYLGASEDETELLQNNAISTHCIYALCDLGIHYNHWGHGQLRNFLQSHGIRDEEDINSIYQNIIDSPGSYLPYTIGYLEICKLKKAFKKAAGTGYTDKKFHTRLLDIGPAPYPVLRQAMLAKP